PPLPPPPPPPQQIQPPPPPPPPQQQQHQQQHPLMGVVAERIASMGPQELETMRRMPDAQAQYPFIFESHAGFGHFRDMLAGLVMPRFQQGGTGAGGGSTG
ncbi:unnamed protein product, partial [Sphacelaria rigidula]